MRNGKIDRPWFGRGSAKAIPILIVASWMVITMQGKTAVPVERPNASTAIRIDLGVLSMHIAIA